MSKSFELFYLLKVLEKSAANEDIIDIYDDTMQKDYQHILRDTNLKKYTRNKIKFITKS